MGATVPAEAAAWVFNCGLLQVQNGNKLKQNGLVCNKTNLKESALFCFQD